MTCLKRGSRLGDACMVLTYQDEESGRRVRLQEPIHYCQSQVLA